MRVLGEVGKGLAVIERVIEAGIAATAAESVGAMEALHAMTLEYSRDPRAVRQADRLVPGGAAPAGGDADVAGAGALDGDAGGDDGGRAGCAERAHNIAMAKVGIGQAGRFVSQNAVQLHGGIGMTEELAVGHYFRRCMVIERLFGDTAHYLAKLAAEVGIGERSAWAPLRATHRVHADCRWVERSEPSGLCRWAATAHNGRYRPARTLDA